MVIFFIVSVDLQKNPHILSDGYNADFIIMNSLRGYCPKTILSLNYNEFYLLNTANSSAIF